jgi:hypothetical protein
MRRFRVVQVFSAIIEAEDSDAAYDIWSERTKHLKANWDNMYDFYEVDEQGNQIEEN